MNTLLFERPVWFATGPLILEEEAQEMEDFIYHRPVLAEEVVKLLAPKPGSLVVDGTCGGGGHTEARNGAAAGAGTEFVRIEEEHLVLAAGLSHRTADRVTPIPLARDGLGIAVRDVRPAIGVPI